MSSDPRQRLGELALAFRATRDDEARRALAAEYAGAVGALIRSGSWDEMPNLEDQLPGDGMPASFFHSWAPTEPVTSDEMPNPTGRAKG